MMAIARKKREGAEFEPSCYTIEDGKRNKRKECKEGKEKPNTQKEGEDEIKTWTRLKLMNDQDGQHRFVSGA